MATVEVQGVEGMQALLGQEIGPSDWRTVDQGMINDFAEIPAMTSGSMSTSSGPRREPIRDDHRPRQSDPLAGRRLPHQPDLLDGLRARRQLRLEQDPLPGPGAAGARVRARAEVVSVDEVGGGWWQVVTRFTLEVEGSEKPCFVGDSVTRVMAPAE